MASGGLALLYDDLQRHPGAVEPIGGARRDVAGVAFVVRHDL